MSAQRPILIVEDDATLRELLAEHLGDGNGFTVVTAGTLEEADKAINDKDSRFDAVILDIGMPDGDGRDYCARLRRSGHKMPVIMLTGSDAEADVVRGLDSGANDYIAKPFRSNELLARLRAQLRLFDGSGLSPDDRVAAITIARLLYDNEPSLYLLLPLGGRQGTLEDYDFTSALGRVRAKSGHLSDVSALAGYANTLHHGRIAFAFMIDGSPGDPDAAIVRAVDRLVEF